MVTGGAARVSARYVAGWMALAVMAGCRPGASTAGPLTSPSPASQRSTAAVADPAPRTTLLLTPGKTVAPAAVPAGDVSVDCRLSTLVSPTVLKTGVLATTTPAAQSLRRFLAAPGRFADLRLGALPRADWALIAESTTYRIFGLVVEHRLGAVVQLKLYHGVWQLYAENCNLTYADGRAGISESVAARGTALDINWGNGTCFPQGPHRHVPEDLGRRAVITETATHVLVSVVVARNPAARTAEAGVTACAGVGLLDHLHAQLRAPIGNRLVLDVGAVPPRVLPTTGTVGQPLR
jgi:hypothetical protein